MRHAFAKLPRRPDGLALLVFGVSLFSVSYPWEGYLPFTLAVSDIVIALILLYSLVRFGRLAETPVAYPAVLLALVIFVSGIINAWSDATFDVKNFGFNYVRIVGLVAIVLLLPPMMRSIGPDRLANATIWATRLQCLFLLLDSVYPIQVGLFNAQIESQPRPSGLFSEPAWFGIWVGFSLLYVAQLQHNLKRRYMSIPDTGLIIVSAVASTGIRGIIFTSLVLMAMLFSLEIRARLRVAGGFAVAALLLFGTAQAFPDIGPSWGWNYLTHRAPGISPLNLQDESALERIYGTARLTTVIITVAPWGTGLGGANERRIREYYDSSVQPLSGMSFADYLVAGGVLGLLLYLFILARMVARRESRLMGCGFVLTTVLWGAPFESFVWWHIALAAALMKTPDVSPLRLPARQRSLHVASAANKPSLFRLRPQRGHGGRT